MNTMQKPSWKYWLALVFGCGLLLSSPLYVAAQDTGTQEIKPLSEKQLGFFVKGLAAQKEKKYAEAIDYYRLALELGESNVLFASMGRAQFFNGSCQKAEENYRKALEAPAVPDPPPEDVLSKVKEYRIGLRRECKGTLELACEPAEVQVRINGGAKRACSDFPIELDPGKYQVSGVYEGGIVDREVEVVGVESTSLTLKVDPSSDSSNTPVVQEPDRGPWDLVAWVTTGVGAVVLLGAFVADNTALADSIDKFENSAQNRLPSEQMNFEDAQSLQTLVQITYVTGLVVTAVGVVLFFVPGAEENPTTTGDNAAGTLQGWVDRHGAGAVYQWRW